MPSLTFDIVSDLIAKIERATGYEVYLRAADEAHTTWFACADKQTEFGIRPVATAYGHTQFGALDALAHKLSVKVAEECAA